MQVRQLIFDIGHSFFSSRRTEVALGGAFMKKSNCLAMILAGGKGSRLGVLTKDQAKPGLLFGGKYRIIDFPPEQLP